MSKNKEILNKTKKPSMGGRDLKILNIEPLSVAKFFYEKGAKNIALVQRLIYLSFLKVLKEKNALLFNEEWQAWLGGPVIESVFQPMSEHLDKYDCNYENLFTSISHTTNKRVLQSLEEVYNEYQNYKKDRKEFTFFDKALSEPWQSARRGLIDELDHQKIKLSEIINYIDQKKAVEVNKAFHFLSIPKQEWVIEYKWHG